MEEKHESRYRPYTFLKNYLKMDHSPKCKMLNCKFLENNIGENLDDLWFGDMFLDSTLKAWKKKLMLVY